MATVKQHDKRSGITYVYESVSYWDKEKKQSRSKRQLIGKIDNETQEIVPTSGKRREGSIKKSRNAQPELETTQFKRRFYGGTYFLDQIGKQLGIIEDLKACFPTTHKQILSLAYYLVLEPDSPMHRFEKWANIHKHPFDADITSQRSSDLFASITENHKMKFFELQAKRRAEDEYWAFDTTSISSYSETLKQVQYGKNKENDALPQLNLALLFGQTSNLPFYYRKLAGNISDSSTVSNLLSDLDALGYQNAKVVLDRGFYSAKNVSELLGDGTDFIMGAKTNLKYVQAEIEKSGPSLKSLENFDEASGYYSTTSAIEWPKSGKKVHVHLFYNIEKAAEEEVALNKKLLNLKKELEENSIDPASDKKFKPYFVRENDLESGKAQYVLKEEDVEEKKKLFGYFCLISSSELDARKVLGLYRNKDVVEKAYGNLKEKLNMRRQLVSSEASLDGKIFVQFIGLIFLSHIKKIMTEKELYKNYTLQGVLDKFDVIECFEYPNKQLRIGEILVKQENLYREFMVNPPTSL